MHIWKYVFVQFPTYIYDWYLYDIDPSSIAIVYRSHYNEQGRHQYCRHWPRQSWQGHNHWSLDLQLWWNWQDDHREVREGGQGAGQGVKSFHRESLSLSLEVFGLTNSKYWSQLSLTSSFKSPHDPKVAPDMICTGLYSQVCLGDGQAEVRAGLQHGIWDCQVS